MRAVALGQLFGSRPAASAITALASRAWYDVFTDLLGIALGAGRAQDQSHIALAHFRMRDL